MTGATEELDAYRALGSFTRHVLVMVSPDLRIIWTSPNFTATLGYKPDEIGEVSVIDLVHPDDMELVLPLAMAVVEDADEHTDRPARAFGVELPIRVKRADNRWLPVAITGRVMDASGRMVCVLRADPERHALDQVLNQLATAAPLTEVLMSIVDLVRVQFGLDHASIIHDADGHPTAVGAPCILGAENAELLGSLRADPVLTVDFRHDGHRWVVPITSPGRDHVWGAFLMPAPDGTPPKPYDLFVMDRSRHLAALAFASDEATRELRRAATHDHLTGVLSRGEFEAQVSKLVARRELPVVVLFIDLDGFKAINDTWGHHHGDQVLVTVAERLQNAVRPTDAVARLGGDEFAVLCRGLRPQQAPATVERIARSLATPVQLSAASVGIGASIGIATAEHPNQIDGLLQRADAEMYQIKRLRRAG